MTEVVATGVTLFRTIEVYRKTRRKSTLENGGAIPAAVTIKIITGSAAVTDVDPFTRGLKRLTTEVQHRYNNSIVDDSSSSSSKRQKRSTSCDPIAGSEFRYAIDDSGRIAYGPTEDCVRMIYRTRSNTKKIINTKTPKTSETPETVSSKLSKLSLKNNAVPAKKHVLGMPPPAPSSSNSKQVAPQRTKPLIRGPQLGVGVGGRAAAMAKMSVLQEEWPEEEELPGTNSGPSYSLTKQGTPDLSAGGVKKEIVGMNARINKLKIAKRNAK